MRQITGNIVVDRPVEAVFAFVADAEANGAKWVAGGPTFVKEGPDPIGLGTAFRYRGTLMGRRISGIRTFTAFEPDTLIVQSNTGLGPVPVAQRIRFEPAGRRTNVALTVEWGRLPRLWPIVEPMIAAVIRRMLPSELARLKAAIEEQGINR